MGRADTLFQSLIEGGMAAVRTLIEQRASEELYLDFKRAATRTENGRLQPDDRDNHAKAISGFGNTAGGVILWGVDCRNLAEDGDIARALFTVPNVDRFKSWLESDVSGATLPSHVGVQHAVCHRESDGSGYIATLIPTADHGPLQVPGQWRYYMRAGSSFIPIPHVMLAGMFGRRPTPQFKITCRATEPLGWVANRARAVALVTARNEGLGIARDLFLSAQIISTPDISLTISSANDPRLAGVYGPAHSRTIMQHPNVAFPPGDEIHLTTLELKLPDVIVNDLLIDISVGCANGPTSHLRLAQSARRLKHTIHLLQQSPSADRNWLADRVFGLAKEDEPIC